MSFGLQNQRIAKTPTGRIDSAYLNGADGSDVVPVWSASIPNLNSVVGTPISIDLVASGMFTDPGSPTSEVGFYSVSGQTPLAAGFTISGGVLSNPVSFASFGTFRLVAIRNGISVLSAPLTFTFTAPVGVDNIAPTIPTSIAVTQGSAVGTISLTCDAPSDVAPGTLAASGCSHVDILVNGAVASPPSPLVTPANALQAPTNVNIGSISSPDIPSFVQAGKTWTLSAAGTGIASTTSEQCLFLQFGSYSGAQKFVALLDAYTSTAGTSLAGIMVHETGVAGGKFIAIGLRPSNGTVGLYVESRASAGAASTQVASVVNDSNGQAIVGPVYVMIERAADNKTWTVSYSANQLGKKVITTQTLAMNVSIFDGLFCTSQSAGTDVLATIEEVSITNNAGLSAIISAASTVSIQLRSVDVSGNVSALSAAIQGVPKQQTTTGKKKFTGGNWANFNTNITSSGFNPTVKSEMAAIAPYPNIPGFHAKMEWGALEPVPGPADTSAKYPKGYATGAALIQSVIDYLQSLTPPRKLVPYAGMGYVTSTHPGSSDWSIFPQWLQTDSTFGPSGGAGYKVGTTTTRVSGRYGWWGADVGQGGVTCTFSFMRPAILNRYIQMWQVFGDYFDGNPALEAVDFAENSFIRGAQQLGGCPDFNYSGWLTAEQTFLLAVQPHWPTTALQWQNTFENNGADTQTTMDWMMANNIDWGATDTKGMTYVNANGGKPYTQGAQVMCGLYTPGSNNYRDMGRLMSPEVEAPDFGAYLGGGYTKEDILLCANNTLKAHRVYWVVLLNAESTYSGIKPGSTWKDLGPFLNDPANALLQANTRPSNFG